MARNTTVEGNGTSSSGLFSFSVQIDQYRNFKERVVRVQSAFNGALTIDQFIRIVSAEIIPTGLLVRASSLIHRSIGPLGNGLLVSVLPGSLTNLPSLAAISNAVLFIETAHNDYISTLAEPLDFDPNSLVASVISAIELGIKVPLMFYPVP
jgi:hypothetical protein